MNGDLARLIALTSYGNAFLSGAIDSAPDLQTQNSAFRHVRSIEFRRAQRRSIHRVDLWFSAVASRGAKRIFVRSDDLFVEGADVREAWLPSTILISEHFEKRQDRQIQTFAETGVWNEEEQFAISRILARAEKPWRLYYDCVPRKSRPRRGAGLAESRAALLDALTEARDFSRRYRLGYIGTFSRSLKLLRSRRPADAHESDLLPPIGYSLDARQVFAAASNAWVFGGMGAFGDVAFDDESVAERFWRLYWTLSAAVVGALLAATNDFDGSQVGSSSA